MELQILAILGGIFVVGCIIWGSMPMQSKKEIEAEIREEEATQANIKIISERLRNNDLSVLTEGYKQHELSIAHLFNAELTLQVIANKLMLRSNIYKTAVSKEASKQPTPEAITKILLPDLKELYKAVPLDAKYQLLPLFFFNDSGKMSADWSPFLGDTEFIDPLRSQFVKLLEKDGLNLESLKQEYLEEFPYSYKLPIGSLDWTERDGMLLHKLY
jgi:hypothetical protein